MRKWYVAWLVAMGACGDPCPLADRDSVLIADESDLASVAKCTELRASVGVLGTELETLARAEGALRSIDGALRVDTNDVLRDVDGLDGLRHVGGDLSVDRNSTLETLQALGGLQTVGGEVVIGRDAAIGQDPSPMEIPDGGNAALSELVGFAELGQIGGRFVVRNNDELMTISGFAGLTEVGDIAVLDGDELQQLLGFGALRTIGGHAVFRNNPKLTELDAFGAVETIAGDLVLDGLGIADADSFSNLRVVEGALEVLGNPELANLDGLAGVSELGAIRIGGNDMLTSLPAWSLNSVPLEIGFGSNARLVSLAGLESVQETGYLTIGFVSFVDLTGLDGLTFVQYDATITDNDVLARLEGLEQLREVGRWFVLADNAVLSSLSRLNRLESVGTSLVIERNAELVEVGALASLTHVGALHVRENPNLEELGFDGLTSVGSVVRIENNPRLPTCQAEALRDRLVALGFDGEFVISGNDDAAVCL